MTIDAPPTPPLSTDATRLLAALRQASAYGPSAAITDRELAARCRIAQRGVIDAAGELLRHGHLVIATCSPPYGRFLLRPGVDDLAPARAYLDVLTSRARGAFERRRLVRLALADAERRQSAAGQPGHQGALFDLAPTQRHQWP